MAKHKNTHRFNWKLLQAKLLFLAGILSLPLVIGGLFYAFIKLMG